MSGVAGEDVTATERGLRAALPAFVAWDHSVFVSTDGPTAAAEERHLTLGDLGRAIGRYTESEGGSSEETLAAHRGLFAIYDQWVDEGRPETSGYDRIRGWMGVEDDDGRVALTQRPEAALTAEPFAVYRQREATDG